jgi:chaperonin cofactor prefoldin
MPLDVSDAELKAIANKAATVLHEKALAMPHVLEKDNKELEATADELGMSLWELKMIDQKLSEVCSTDEEGYAVYTPGWSDERVASEVGTLMVKEHRQILLQELNLEWQEEQLGSTEPLSPNAI